VLGARRASQLVGVQAQPGRNDVQLVGLLVDPLARDGSRQQQRTVRVDLHHGPCSWAARKLNT
jgi:hypothetical protein